MSCSRPAEVCDIERLKNENSELSNTLCALKEALHEKELGTEILEKEKSHLETHINLVDFSLFYCL